MTPRSERFTESALGGVRLHALHWGVPGRPVVVLLHGGGANAHWWDHLAERLAARFTAVALDFRGHGDSDHPAERARGDFERDLAALLAHLGAPDAALVGHSMGAHVALSHAAQAPAPLPRALVLVEPTRGAPPRDRRRMRLALAVRRTYATREQAIDHYRFLPPAPRAPEALRRHIAGHSVREEDGRFAYKFDPRWFALPPAERPELSRVTSPALVLRGAESALLTAAGAAELASELPRARVVEIAEAGHNLHLEQPEAFLAAVLPFLADPS